MSANAADRRMALLQRMGLFGTIPESVEITRATTLEDLHGAYRLVHDVFLERGYIHPMPGGLRIRPHEAMPETATFVAEAHDRVVGVQSLVVDTADLGLPSDAAFKREIDTLRRQGRHICEATNEAISPEYRKTSVPTELMRCFFAHAMAVGCDDVITAVSPGHARFYALMGFDPIGPVRSYSQDILDPVVLVRCRLETLQERMAKESGILLVEYYYNSNLYHAFVKPWCAAAERLFADAGALRELFVERSGLLTRCSRRELAAIRRRWGEELFATVTGTEREEKDTNILPAEELDLVAAM